MRRHAVPLLLAACTAIAAATTAGAQDDPSGTGAGSSPGTYTIPGDKVFPEGIAREPGSQAFYVTSTTDGTVFRGTLSSSRLTPFAAPGAAGRITAIGLKSDGRGRLVVAGGATGKVFVLSTRDGSTRKVLDTKPSGDSFLNDVAISKGYAYITDSRQPFLYRVRLGTNAIGPVEKFVSFAGSPFAYDKGFNANGIAVDEGGNYAIIVQSGTGKLFRVGLRDRSVVQVDLLGRTVKNGDGLLLKAGVLYVARNRQERIVPVRLFVQGRIGAVGPGSPDLS